MKKLPDILLVLALLFLVYFLFGKSITAFIGTKVAEVEANQPMTESQCIDLYKARIDDLRQAITDARQSLNDGGQDGYREAQDTLGNAPDFFTDPDCGDN